MKKSLPKNSLYILLNDGLIKKGFGKICREVIKGGADVIQLRVKSLSDGDFLKIARDLRKITHRYNIPFIINDRVDIAIASEADGVHLGQNDFPLSIARNLPGILHKIIGVSTHNLRQALKARKDGADYISVGPVFPTPTKPQLKAKGIGIIRRVKQRVNIPVVAIGGINSDNIEEVILTGVDGIAVVSAVSAAKNTGKATWQLKSQILSK